MQRLNTAIRELDYAKLTPTFLKIPHTKTTEVEIRIIYYVYVGQKSTPWICCLGHDLIWGNYFLHCFNRLEDHNMNMKI